MSELNCYIHYSEYDFNKNYPTLVIQGDYLSVGYDVDKDTGDLRRVCICAAHSDTECVCGAWDYLNNQE